MTNGLARGTNSPRLPIQRDRLAGTSRCMRSCHRFRVRAGKVRFDPVEPGTGPPAAMIGSVQYLRAIAAVAVVIAHASGAAVDYFGYFSPVYGLVSVGGCGVDVFFVISGFIISYTVIEREQPRGEFAVNRISRIVPPYWLLSMLVVCLFITFPGLFRQMQIVFIDVASSLAFVRWIQNKSPNLYVGWTLQYEAIFYASVAALFAHFKRISTVDLGLATAAIGIAPTIAAAAAGYAFYRTFELRMYQSTRTLLGHLPERKYRLRQGNRISG